MVKNILDENIRTNKDISVYSKNNPEEMIAEAFSKYSYDPRYSDFVYKIGSCIDELYKMYEDSEIFNISEQVLIKK